MTSNMHDLLESIEDHIRRALYNTKQARVQAIVVENYELARNLQDLIVNLDDARETQRIIENQLHEIEFEMEGQC